MIRPNPLLGLALALASSASAAPPEIPASAAGPLATPMASSASASSEVAKAPAAPLPAPVADPILDRLLGDETPVAVAPAIPADGGIGAGLGGLWPLGLAAIGAGLVWLARKRVPGLATPADGPWIVGRSALTGGTQLLVVEVLDAAGRRKRLLVTSGAAGASLLADLGEEDGSIETEAPSLGPALAPRPAPPPHVERAHVERALEPSLAAVTSGRGKAAAMSLIDEVVSTRRAPHDAADRYSASGRA